MKRKILLMTLVLCANLVHAQSEKQDTTKTDTTLQGVKMKEVIVTKDKRLPIFVSPQTKEGQPRVKSLSDIVGPKATDMIMHPFAFKSRKEERRRRKALKKLWEYEHVKTDGELLREALIREGIDPDSLMREHMK
ncbi:MAG: hypothetical protein IJT19_08270 [Bacteroidaceae bacterium]|nr:hypothetical protein [Bacteroidaceae bacterium]